MKNFNAILFAFSTMIFLIGCSDAGESTTLASDAASSAIPNSASVNLAAEFASEWPPAGCLDAKGLRAYRSPPNPGKETDIGLYSGDETATSNGNIFWLGFDHGNNVLPPNIPYKVPDTPQGQGYLLRWNISDTVVGANQHISNHYKWDYDKKRDGEYAVNAVAINKCKPDGDSFVCQQALFGQAAWEGDQAEGDFELCPPIILPEDPGSVYVYDLNNNNVEEQYEYSLALILTAGGQKSGLRLIIDPKVTNGGN